MLLLCRFASQFKCPSFTRKIELHPWDDTYQMSNRERDLAIESVVKFSPSKAIYVLQLPLERQMVSVFVVQDTRTAVFGICRIADLNPESKRFYFDPQNEFKIIHMTSDLAWVNMRKAFALSLPRQNSQNGDNLDL